MHRIYTYMIYTYTYTIYIHILGHKGPSLGQIPGPQIAAGLEPTRVAAAFVGPGPNDQSMTRAS